MTKAEFFALCYEAKFDRSEDCVGLTGISKDDERVYVCEYPCGDSLLKLANLLGITIDDGLQEDSHGAT